MMYVPEQFKESDSEAIAALIKKHSFGMLVTLSAGTPFVTHLPFLFERSNGSQGKLFGHLARANPQWRHFIAGEKVLAVFQGPHAYISPSWFSAPGVPTWNYAVVHLRGVPRLIENESELEALVEQLTHAHESHRSNPWQIALTGEQRSRLLRMIVGFEIEITEIEAKFKLSQNRSVEDQQQIMQALSLSAYQSDIDVSQLMSEKFSNHGSSRE